MSKPHWAATDKPLAIITDMDDVIVDIPREVKRFHVAVRMGSSGLNMKLTDATSKRLRDECAKVGPDSWYEFDYGMQEAIIYAPSESITLAEWSSRYPGVGDVDPMEQIST